MRLFVSHATQDDDFVRSIPKRARTVEAKLADAPELPYDGAAEIILLLEALA